ncbi:ABC transporter substrate-binding protein [Kitasatospora sp. NPDC087315]|uniref:bifunctional serine/threonine-protein kinase/ABC transporter substrate-binding protein n=1 Tax=Kitasatospora sp. NPDC087315 TaxID=3364069 RepID=UPI00380F4C5A
MTQDDADLIAGRYQLIDRIGQGGMGRVWRGVDRQVFDREVAVKEILFPPGLEEDEREMLLRRFTSEARAAAILSHTSIVTIHDVVEHRGSPVIVMELVRGQSLAAALREQGRLPVPLVAAIGRAMLGALTEAHAARIIHRDLKPDNILLARDRVVLTDFGIAYLADASTKLSHSGTLIGTPHYMPPEQLQGKRPTTANDLWALGATLYHAVEGTTPFQAEGLHALAIAIFTQPHRPPVQAGPLVPLLEALLIKDPARRATVAQAEELLTAVLRDADAPGPSTPSLAAAGPARQWTPTAPDVRPEPGATAAPEAAATPDTPEPSEASKGPEPPPALAPTPVPDSPYAWLPTLPAPADAAAPTPALPPAPAPELTPGSFRGPGGARPADDLPRALAANAYATPRKAAPSRRPVARRATVLVLALATVAAGGILAWDLAQGGSGSTGGATGGSGTSVAPANDASTAIVVIGLDAPLTGALATHGLGIKDSADLAVKDANRMRHVPGVTFKLKVLDDQAQPRLAQQNATQFVADSTVLGVVGPLTASAAQTMLPVLDPAHLVDVSPSNTAPQLSQGSDWASGAKSRPHRAYYRTSTTDAAQGPFAARYLFNDAKKTKVFVIDDQMSYGSGLASGFRAEFTRLGGTIVGAEHHDSQNRDYSALAAKVRASGADAVYYGGQYPEAAPLSQQIKQAGAAVPLMGGDGIYDAEYIRSNSKAEGDLATSVGVPMNTLPSAATYLSAFRAAGYSGNADPYGGYAYDATWAVIEAVKAVVSANRGRLPADARAEVAAAMGRVSFDGVTGHIAFDEYGDTTDRQLAVSSVKSGVWSTVTTGTYTP